MYLTHDDGRCYTIAQWAKKTNQKSSTLYKRREYGWSDMEIITGIREGLKLSVTDNPFPPKFRDYWEGSYLNSVGCGYNGTRLDFLNEKCTESAAIFRKKAIELDNQIVYLPEGEERTDLQAKLDYLNEGYQKYIKTVQETQFQIDYEHKKSTYISKGSTKEIRMQMAKHFEKMVPRPNYTINKPKV